MAVRGFVFDNVSLHNVMLHEVRSYFLPSYLLCSTQMLNHNNNAFFKVKQVWLLR